ncbi:hypothetical protein D3C80_771180 [compost metagenome]
MADNRQFLNMDGECHQYRQEGDERHNGVNKAHAHIFQRRSKTHGVFLHTLRCTLDMTQLLPMRHIVFVHRGTPAEHVVAHKEVIHHPNEYRNQRNPQENTNFLIEPVNRDLMR